MTGVPVASFVRAGVALLVMAGFGSCKKAPEADAGASAETAAPALNPDEPRSDVERAKKARAAALASKEATKRAVELAQSASAAAKNAAAAALRAADAADAAVEAIRKIPQAAPSDTPAARPQAGK